MATFIQTEEWLLAAEITEECYRIASQELDEREESLSKSLRHSSSYLAGSLASLPRKSGRHGVSHKYSGAMDEIRRLESNLRLAVRLGHLSEPDIMGIVGKLDTLSEHIRKVAQEAQDAYKETMAKQNPFMDMSELFSLD